jgi:hypothetical protein
MSTDLLGRALTAEEQRVADLYEELKSLLSDSSGLPPCAVANLRSALASVAVTVADLGIAYEHLIDYGC